MPYDEPDATDPLLLCGVSVPGDAESAREMAYTFAEEYAQLGYEEERILKLFQNGEYAAPHGALQALGEAEIARIVKECWEAFGRVHFTVRDAPPLYSIRRCDEKEGG
jgi:hypothetical protein